MQISICRAKHVLVDTAKRTSRVDITSAWQTAGAMPQTSEPTRRDFLYVATTSVGVVGAALATVPFIDQMNPDAAVLAAGGPIDVDLKDLGDGQQIVARWRSHPIFIVSRPENALAELRDPALLAQLADPQSQERQQPEYAENPYRSIKPEFGVLVAICTHLGCIPRFYAAGSPDSPLGGFGGYLCPCHGSKYDLAGRVFRDVPAPYNLPVPPYRYVSDSVLRIGENPMNSNFDFSSILQI